MSATHNTAQRGRYQAQVNGRYVVRSHGDVVITGRK